MTGERRIDAPWGVREVLLVFALWLISAGLGPELVRWLSAAEPPLWLRVAAQVPGFLLAGVVGIALALGFGERGRHALGLGGGSVGGLARGILAYVPLGATWWGLVLVYELVLRSAGVEVPRQRIGDLVVDPGLGAFERGLLFAAIALAAPFAEETVFRGLLHGWLRRYLALPPAAWLGGVVFGLLHVEDRPQSLLFVPPLALLGVFLGYVRERFGGLWGCYTFHAAHNLLTLAVLCSGT